MNRQRKITVAKCAAVLSALPLLVYAYSTGPDPRKTGVPGEGLCTECHAGTANSAGGSVAVSFPGGLSYTPGVTQRLTVTITDATARVYGFQLTARLASDLSNGQAGSLTPLPGDSVFVLCADGSVKGAAGCPASVSVESIEHNQPRTSNSFAFDWTPPASDQGAVRIFVAGNAANGDNTNNGDHIYTANYTLTAAAQANAPQIALDAGVRNAASFDTTIGPGAWVAIFGTNMSPTTRFWRADEIVNGKLPTQLDGISVTINGKRAAVNYISPGQLNVQAPADDAVGSVQVQLTTPQGTSTVTTNLQPIAPGFFAYTLTDPRYVAAQHADGSILAKANLFPGATSTPAKPGEVIVLYGTGFGPTNPPTPTGQVVTQAAPCADLSQLSFQINNEPASIQFAGIIQAGVYQFNIVVPSDLTDGDYPITATLNGQRTQDGMLITVQKP